MNNFKFDLKEVMQAMKEIPFGNSNFQIEHFIAKKESPERSYRQILLEMHEKIIVFKQCELRRKRLEIDIRELNEKIKTATSEFDKERFLLDIEEKEFNLENEKKLIEDALIELSMYDQLRKKYPKYNRIEFENSEYNHWKDRLLADAQASCISMGRPDKGSVQALEKINIKVVANKAGELMFESMPLESTKILENKL